MNFPDIKGILRKNLYVISQRYLFYSPYSATVPQPVAQIPWGHNRLIINKIKNVEQTIELKAGKFKPEFAGKLNYYLSAINSQLKHPSDNPSIGLILCKHKDKVEVEYSLRDINKPIGISEYILTQALPDNFKSNLPTVEQLEHQLSE